MKPDRPGPGPDRLVDYGGIPGGKWMVAWLTIGCAAFWIGVFAALFWR